MSEPHTTVGDFGAALADLLGVPKHCKSIVLRAEPASLVEADITHYVNTETTPIDKVREVFAQYVVVSRESRRCQASLLARAVAYITAHGDAGLREGNRQLLLAELRNTIKELTQ